MYNHVTYMRAIATKLKRIQHVEGDDSQKHFFRVSSLANMEELIQNLTGVSGYALVVEDMRMGRFIDNDSENLLDNQSRVFMLIKQVNNADAASRENAIKDCETECMKIFAKMFVDRRNDYKFSLKTGLRNLDRNSIYYQTVGPLGDNMHGMMYTFNIMPALNSELVYDENEWLSDVIS
jgi:hypothetical protein